MCRLLKIQITSVTIQVTLVTTNLICKKTIIILLKLVNSIFNKIFIKQN